MYVIRRVSVAHAELLKAGKAWSETSREVDAWGGVAQRTGACSVSQKSHVEAGREAGRTGIPNHLVERATYYSGAGLLLTVDQ